MPRVDPGSLQGELFAAAPERRAASLPPGMAWQDDFLDLDEETALLEEFAGLPLQPARYKGHVARREVLSYGDDPDRPMPLPPVLQELRERVALWMGLAAGELIQTLVARYGPGTPLGWHIDAPQYGQIAGVSLGGVAVLRFRRNPPRPPVRAGVLRWEAPPRSVYRLRGASRWAWQHSVAPTPALRWSVTFRTAREPMP